MEAIYYHSVRGVCFYLPPPLPRITLALAEEAVDGMASPSIISYHISLSGQVYGWAASVAVTSPPARGKGQGQG